METPILQSLPILNRHQNRNVKRRFLGFPIEYETENEQLIQITPDINVKQAFNKTSEELELTQEYFNNTIVLKFDFNQ